jgi:peptidoglycan/LPS O-acetylase OafA/YrhL
VQLTAPNSEALAANSPPAAATRIPELDGVRGIAILMVLMTHLYAYSMLGRPWSGLARLVLEITEPGWLGVDLFFVLSGFLITGNLMESRGTPHYFQNFYIRRALRILPLYFAVLAVLAVFYNSSGSFVILGLLMSVNLAPLFHVAVASGGQALWSLAIEEHFYLLWPWVVRFVRPAALIAVSIGICIAEPAIRASARFAFDDVYIYSWFRFDGLAWGALIAVLVRAMRANPQNMRRVALRLAGSMFAVAVAITAGGARYGILHRGNRLGAALQFTLAEMVFAGGILALVTLSGSPAAALFRWRPLTLTGDLSYCLYVVHMMAMDLFDLVASHYVDLKAEMNRFSFIAIRAAATIALCYCIALLSRRFLEQPVLRLKRYIVPSKATA